MMYWHITIKLVNMEPAASLIGTAYSYYALTYSRRVQWKYMYRAII